MDNTKMTSEQTMSFWIWLSAGREERSARISEGNRSVKIENKVLFDIERTFMKVITRQEIPRSRTPFETTFMALRRGLDSEGKSEFEHYLRELIRSEQGRKDRVRPVSVRPRYSTEASDAGSYLLIYQRVMERYEEICNKI